MKRILALLLILIGTVLICRWELSRMDSDGTSPVYSSRVATTPTRTIHVLFVGDSYIYVNNLPKILTEIASSDAGNTIEIDTQSVTRGGKHLSDLLQSGEATNLIASRHWDYVVLQEQSTWMLEDEDGVKNTFAAAASFASEIRAAGAVPMIYLTWIREPGSDWYQPPYQPVTQSPDYMQSQIDKDTYLLATSINARVVPAGDAWAASLKGDPALSLYRSEGSHPSPVGTYLVAMMFYRSLTNNRVDQVEYSPSGISAADQDYLRNLVDMY